MQPGQVGIAPQTLRREKVGMAADGLAQVSGSLSLALSLSRSGLDLEGKNGFCVYFLHRPIKCRDLSRRRKMTSRSRGRVRGHLHGGVSESNLRRARRHCVASSVSLPVWEGTGVPKPALRDRSGLFPPGLPS